MSSFSSGYISVGQDQHAIKKKNYAHISINKTFFSYHACHYLVAADQTASFTISNIFKSLFILFLLCSFLYFFLYFFEKLKFAFFLTSYVTSMSFSDINGILKKLASILTHMQGEGKAFFLFSIKIRRISRKGHLSRRLNLFSDENGLSKLEKLGNETGVLLG